MDWDHIAAFDTYRFSLELHLSGPHGVDIPTLRSLREDTDPSASQLRAYHVGLHAQLDEDEGMIR